MTKSILISIQPKWVEKILNGEKTIEIRKTIPKCELPIDVYIYCTKSKEHLVETADYPSGVVSYQIKKNRPDIMMNGKVVAKFTLNKIDRYDYGNMDYPTPAYEGDSTCKKVGDGYWIKCGELERTCLTYEELLKYGKGKTLYGWHIDNLEKFDKYKELSEFKIPNPLFENVGAFGWAFNDEPRYIPLKKAPQSWCYVEDQNERN